MSVYCMGAVCDVGVDGIRKTTLSGIKHVFHLQHFCSLGKQASEVVEPLGLSKTTCAEELTSDAGGVGFSASE